MTSEEYILAAALLAVNLLGFVLMGFDKGRAITGGYRVPGKTLLLTALFGGAAGVGLGMYLFRHKTRHPRFCLGVPAIFALQAAIVWLV